MTRMTDDDRWVIQRARELAPAMRGTVISLQERLAAELLEQLADLAERLDSPDRGGQHENPPSR